MKTLSNGTQVSADTATKIEDGIVTALAGAELIDFDTRQSSHAQSLEANILASSWERLRRKRNSLLVSSDWTQSPDSPLDDEAKVDWVIYRQELRDLPATTDDPADPTWPEMPE